MSQSEIFDSLLIAADYPVGEAQWDAAMSAVEELGGWEFECRRQRRAFTLSSFDDLLKQVYSVDGISAIAARPNTLVLNPRTYADLQKQFSQRGRGVLAELGIPVVTDIDAPMDRVYLVDPNQNFGVFNIE